MGIKKVVLIIATGLILLVATQRMINCMCDEFVGRGRGVAKVVFEDVLRAYLEWVLDQDDESAFNKLDWAIKLLGVKWDSYATARRCAEGRALNMALQGRLGDH
jgi:hypothetical protein